MQYTMWASLLHLQWLHACLLIAKDEDDKYASMGYMEAKLFPELYGKHAEYVSTKHL